MSFSSTSDDDSSSSRSPSSSSDDHPNFPQFVKLPPEIRHQIWLSVIPSPGINSFNVHSFPYDHQGANRSTSPPWLYLDLRRLDINDDDETVSSYDPSAWQARCTLRRTCREARLLSALPPSKSATITLTRPKRGLYIRAADGQLLRGTPLQDLGPSRRQPVEPQVKRRIQVSIDDVLSLSVENCSFSLPHEESHFADGVLDDDVDGLATGDDDLGWTYDPQLTPPLPPSIPPDRYCLEMSRGGGVILLRIQQAVEGIFNCSVSQDRQNPLMIMFNSGCQALGERSTDELTPAEQTFWDRFGDCYLPFPLGSNTLNAAYRLTKIWPEKSDIRERYRQSSLLQSPKRPVNKYYSIDR
ncbi:hypothetical protein F5Y15DRAFT_52462 [Xylariaceae sp. FL0016]|nr:hypothetical protein F5Y15DRAFT_52462 [Xylariaceae sp. FL0016]